MAITVSNIHLGFADIWVGGTAPATGNPPTAVTVTASGVPSNIGSPVYVGATQGEAKLMYKPTLQNIEVEQSLSEVDTFLQSEEANLSFGVAESTAANINRAIGQGLLTDQTTYDIISVGGTETVTKTLFTLVSKQRNTSPDLFFIVCFYAGYSTEGLEMTFSKSKETIIPMTVKGFADLTRDPGDQIFQFIKQKTA